MTPKMNKVHLQRKNGIKEVHEKLRTGTVIYMSLQEISNSLKGGGGVPLEIVNHFDFDLDRMLKGAWKERRAIGWDQLLKGQLSERWGNRTGNVL